MMKLFKRCYDNNKLNNVCVSNFKEAKNMLIVTPHPDDEVIGCGGMLIKYGSKFDVICISSAGVAFDSLDAKQRSDVRIQEFHNVMDYLQIKNNWIFETYGDPPFFEQIENHFEEYCSKLNFLKYDYIFCPYPYDSHPEHAYITKKLLKRLLNKNGCSKDTYVVFFEVWTPIARPNYYEPIDEEIEEKMKVIQMYSSQLVDGWDYDRWINGLNSYRSMYNRHHKYSEAFQILPIKKYLKKDFKEFL